jgi:nucleoside-diphosphate-sugar epimerase
MRVVVVGASGNIGTSVLSALQGDAAVDQIVAVARRTVSDDEPGIKWLSRDVATDDLRPDFEGADAVICLAWLIQPSHQIPKLQTVNVKGSRRVFQAAAEAGVETLLYSSSVGAYSYGPKDHAVDESWPTEGTPSSFYARHKAEVERILDRFQLRHPRVRVVRMRPALVFKREASSEIRRLFIGPLFPGSLARPPLIPVVPRTARLRFQAVHSLDVGEAFRLALHANVEGPFNLAADPILDGDELARLLHARAVSVPAKVLRGAAAISWRLHLQPTSPGWVDMALAVPIMDCTRAREELRWTPRRSAQEALLDLMRGLRERAGGATPPLDPDAGGTLRWRELVTGVGGREQGGA